MFMDIKTQQLMVTKFHEIAPDVEVLFNYLNGRVNPHNPCVLNIDYFSQNNYAQYQAPNLLTVFLCSIIQSAISIAEVEGHPDKVYHYIMSIAALTITHELTHSEQCIDPKKYGSDGKYATMIEESAEYNAEIFCMSHIQEFKNTLGFEFLITSRTNPTASPIWGVKEHVLSVLYGIFRCKPIVDHVEQFLNGDGNVAIAIKQAGEPDDAPGDVIPIRVDGHLLDTIDSIKWFNDRLMRYRHMICSYEYEYSIFTSIYSNSGVDYNTLVIIIDSKAYEPFLFR